MKPFLLALALVGGAAYAQVYRCPSADGSLVLQQRPCPGGVKLAVPDAPTAGSRAARVEAAVAQREVFIGMTRDEALRSWGRPTAINKSVRASGVSEQWVYRHARGTQFLYFDDGVLQSLQTPE